MTEKEPGDVVLEHLRRIRATQGHHSHKLDELKSGQTLIRGDIQNLSGHVFHQEYRIASASRSFLMICSGVCFLPFMKVLLARHGR